MATTQEALQVSTILPSFTVDDLQKSIAFYEALGFTVDERWEDNGTLLGVMMRAGKQPDRLEPGRLEEGTRPEEGHRHAGLPVDYTERRRDRGAGPERRHQAHVGTARHRVEEPGVRGHRSERVLADDLRRKPSPSSRW